MCYFAFKIYKAKEVIGGRGEGAKKKAGFLFKVF